MAVIFSKRVLYLFVLLLWEAHLRSNILIFNFYYFLFVLWSDCLNVFKAASTLASYYFNNVAYMFVYIIIE